MNLAKDYDLVSFSKQLLMHILVSNTKQVQMEFHPCQKESPTSVIFNQNHSNRKDEKLGEKSNLAFPRMKNNLNGNWRQIIDYEIFVPVDDLSFEFLGVCWQKVPKGT